MKEPSPLGQLITAEVGRDAIHVAIAPCIAAEQLYPGQRVALLDASGLAGPGPKHVGIVDPYLTHPVPKDAKFWLCLFPNTITSLNHNWTHPAFVAPEPAGSEKWLRVFAEEAGLGYEQMLDIVKDYVESGEPWVEHDSESARNAFYGINEQEFWRHFEAVTGIKDPGHDFGSPFSCSC